MGRTACTEPQCLYKCALYLTFFLSLFLGQTSAESETKSSDIDGVIKRCLVTVTVCYSTALSIMNLI